MVDTFKQTLAVLAAAAVASLSTELQGKKVVTDNATKAESIDYDLLYTKHMV